MLQVDARPLKRSERSSRGSLLAKGKVSAFTSSDALRSASSLYASHSVLASGRWAKIRVSETGLSQLTLMHGAGAGGTAGQDLGTLRNETTQLGGVLIIDALALLIAELAHLTALAAHGFLSVSKSS